MFTDRQLTKAYENAKIEYFDQNSKYIFFSDLHRGDDSVSDEFTRNQPVLLHALDYYYHNDYTYVELGDGDELWEYPDFKHIRMAHSDIFTALKNFYDQKKLVLIYGNHNIYLKKQRYLRKNYFRYYDEYRLSSFPLFPKIKAYEAIVLKHKHTGQEIFAVHGHQGDFFNDQFWFLSMIALRYFWRYLHVVGFRNPASPAKNVYKRHKIEKNYKKWIHKHQQMLICGHTHRPRFPIAKELPYFNTGCCIHTKGISGIEILNGKILMVNWRVKANEQGTLQIIRSIVKGPEAIKKYRWDRPSLFRPYESSLCR
ncbi:serine/threonine protein phosphatase [Lachnospiraceae bacterium ZAX-1]